MTDNSILYQAGQRQRTLAAVLYIVLGTAAALGLLNIQFRTWGSVIALLGLAVLCLPLLLLNARGHVTWSAGLLSALLVVVIGANMLDGDGIRDSGLLAYPILILIGTLFFGKRAAPLFALVSVISLGVVVYFEIGGFVQPTIGPTRFDILIPIVYLILAATALVWVVVANIERQVQRVDAFDAELRQTYDRTLAAWASVLEYRDRETEGHSRRVVDLCLRLARALDCTEHELAQLRRGALLHDIGKLAIPDSVLLKPGVLDERERGLIEQHPVYAKQMLAEIPFLQPAVAVAYSHHERWDGQGYPEGLRGEAIPLLARIFAVVDTWDALISERVYRRAWTRAEVIVYIRENAGIRFDPHIVEVFLRVVEGQS